MVAGLAVALFLCLTVSGQSMLYGSNSLTVSMSSIDPILMDVSDTFTVTYRYDRFTLSSRTSLGVSGLTGQSFRLSTPLGSYSLRGSVSFSDDAFSSGNLAVSGSWEGIAFTTTLLLSNLGTTQSPSYGAGMTFRVSGGVEGLGRLTIVTGIGATPYGSVSESCQLEFGGARISWSGLELCGGTAGVDVVFDCDGPDSQYASWTVPVPFCDLQFRVYSVFEDLLDFTGMTWSLGGTLWGVRTNGTLAFDESLAFTQGSWSTSGDLLGGRLSSTVSYDEAEILSQSFTWSRAFDYWSLTLSPEFDILSFGWGEMEFDVPSLRATLRWDLACCFGMGDDIDLGDLVVNLTVSREELEQISATYSMVF